MKKSHKLLGVTIVALLVVSGLVISNTELLQGRFSVKNFNSDSNKLKPSKTIDNISFSGQKDELDQGDLEVLAVEAFVSSDEKLNFQVEMINREASPSNQTEDLSIGNIGIFGEFLIDGVVVNSFGFSSSQHSATLLSPEIAELMNVQVVLSNDYPEWSDAYLSGEEVSINVTVIADNLEAVSERNENNNSLSTTLDLNNGLY